MLRVPLFIRNNTRYRCLDTAADYNVLTVLLCIHLMWHQYYNYLNNNSSWACVLLPLRWCSGYRTALQDSRLWVRIWLTPVLVGCFSRVSPLVHAWPRSRLSTWNELNLMYVFMCFFIHTFIHTHTPELFMNCNIYIYIDTYLLWLRFPLYLLYAVVILFKAIKWLGFLNNYLFLALVCDLSQFSFIHLHLFH